MTNENFPVMTNERLLNVIKGTPVDKTPVWIMRQAGRYLPEFRETRIKHDFFTICQTPELACTVTLQPIDRFAGLFDASIIFSDILVIPQALGMEVQMVPGKGPHFPAPLEGPQDLARLDTGEKDLKSHIRDRLGYVYQAITVTRKALDGRVPLFGFTGAPWTLMAYMIEGGGSKTLSKAKKWLVAHRAASHKLLQLLTDSIVEYLVAQIEAGAQIVQVFDSWAGELSPAHFREYALPYLKQISDKVKARFTANVPMVVFAKGAYYAIGDLVKETKYDVIGLDWTMDIRRTKQMVREALAQMPIDDRRRISLQGNMDPIFLHAPDQVLEMEAERIITEFLTESDGSLTQDIGYVCNLGHGIQPDVPVENVSVFLKQVDSVSRKILLK